MKKIKTITVILVIIAIIIFITILILVQRKQIEQPISQESDVSQDYLKSLGIVDNYNTFFSVEKMLNNYISKIKSKNNEAVYNLLDSTYIKEQNITQENVLNYFADIIKYDSSSRIRKIYSNENIYNAVYYIDCILENKNENKEFYFILYEDRQSSTYSIEPIEEKKFEENIMNSQKALEEKRIISNDFNSLLHKIPTEEERVERYLRDILENMLYYPEYAYDMLETNYKNKCFPTLQEFKEYIENKREEFSSYDLTNLKQFGEFNNMEEYLLYLSQSKNLKLEEYQIRELEDGNRYICIDNFGNYFIFYASDPLNYKVILDNYSVPTSEFTEQYNNNSEVEKVVLNIKRFFMGIDDKNYGYSYNVLSESFKNSKYPSKNDFVNYAKQNFFEENEIEYISYEKENNLYIYKIRITDATGNSQEEKTLNIIVKLKEGTDFEMSFGEQ